MENVSNRRSSCQLPDRPVPAEAPLHANNRHRTVTLAVLMVIAIGLAGGSAYLIATSGGGLPLYGGIAFGVTSAGLMVEVGARESLQLMQRT